MRLFRQMMRAAFLSAGLVAGGQAAQNTTMVVAWPAGGTTDLLGRIIANYIGQVDGTKVIVENKPGAGGNIGAQEVVRAKPDGRTMLLTAAAVATASSIYANPGFKLMDNLQPVTIVGAVPFMLVVRKSLPVNSVKELIAYAKAHPGQLNFGSGGYGTIVHLAGELLKLKSGIAFTHVPFKGSGGTLEAMLAGNIDFTIDGGPPVIQQIKAGNVKLLAVASDKRLKDFPDVPTIEESGVAGLGDFTAGAWQGMFVPGGTPLPIRNKLNEQIAAAVNQPQTSARLRSLGVVPVVGSVATTDAFVRSEMVKWAAVAHSAGIKPQ